MMNTGDTAWVTLATLLVMQMTIPALALFYGGMVRKKNLLSTLNLSFITFALISLQWVLIGYSLAFAPTIGGVIGNLSFAGFAGVGGDPNETYAATIPHLSFAAFQMVFATIAAALISGAVVERVRLSRFLLFILLWSTLIYCPVAHWVWGVGGFLRSLGALDFAGGTVVHILAGFSALAVAVVLRPRKSWNRGVFEPNNIPFTLIGASLLWFGWFGFNGGSALAINGLAIQAIVNTNIAAAAGALAWMALSWKNGRPGILGTVTGAVVGLVAITPACGFVTPLSAFLIGALSAPISFYAMQWRQKSSLDDSLDVWACHGLGGVWGALATGLFATTTINSAGANGLFYGNAKLLGVQIVAVVVSALFAFVGSYLLAKGVDTLWGLSVGEEKEMIGLDMAEHGERPYA